MAGNTKSAVVAGGTAPMHPPVLSLVHISCSRLGIPKMEVDVYWLWFGARRKTRRAAQEQRGEKQLGREPKLVVDGTTDHGHSRFTITLLSKLAAREETQPFLLRIPGAQPPSPPHRVTNQFRLVPGHIMVSTQEIGTGRIANPFLRE